jgi:hypothetical protein
MFCNSHEFWFLQYCNKKQYSWPQEMLYNHVLISSINIISTEDFMTDWIMNDKQNKTLAPVQQMWHTQTNYFENYQTAKLHNSFTLYKMNFSAPFITRIKSSMLPATKYSTHYFDIITRWPTTVSRHFIWS